MSKFYVYPPDGAKLVTVQVHQYSWDVDCEGGVAEINVIDGIAFAVKAAGKRQLFSATGVAVSSGPFRVEGVPDKPNVKSPTKKRRKKKKVVEPTVEPEQPEEVDVSGKYTIDPLSDCEPDNDPIVTENPPSELDGVE